MEAWTLKFLFEACKRAILCIQVAKIDGQDYDLAVIEALAQLRNEFEEIAKLTHASVQFQMCDAPIVRIAAAAALRKAFRKVPPNLLREQAEKDFWGVLEPVLSPPGIN